MIGVLSIYLRNNRSKTCLNCRIDYPVDHSNKIIIGYLYSRRMWYIYNKEIYRAALDMTNIFSTR